MQIDTKFQNKVISHNRPTIGAEEIKAAADAAGNLELTVRTKVKEFEEAFSDYIYHEILEDMIIINPLESEDKKHVYSRYAIRTPHKPSEIIEKMWEHNVVCERMYGMCLHCIGMYY